MAGNQAMTPRTVNEEQDALGHVADRRVIGIGRVSTKKQAQGTSLANQKDGVQKICKSRNLHLLRWFELAESGKSAGTSMRECLQYAKNKNVKTLVVWDVDRLSRNTAELQGIYSKFQVIFVQTPNLNASKADDRFCLGIKGELGMWEHNENSERVKNAIKRRKTIGFANQQVRGVLFYICPCHLRLLLPWL